jgi:hypothetical protein
MALPALLEGEEGVTIELVLKPFPFFPILLFHPFQCYKKKECRPETGFGSV